MKRCSCSFAVTALTLCLSGFVLGSEPLDAFSNQAGVLIRLKNPKATIDKTALLADAVQVGLGDAVRRNAAGLGTAISIPGLEGVDQSRDWYAVLFFHAQQSRPDIVFAIPSTDTAQLTTALPDQMTSEVNGDWVLYTDSDGGIPERSESDVKISAIMKDHLANVFDRGDVSVFINFDRLTDIYGDEIQSAHESTTAAMKQVAAIASQMNGMDMTAVMDMYGTMIDGGFTALADADGFSIAITVDSDGAEIEEYVTFADGSTTSGFLNGHPTSSMAALNKLPQGAAAYFGFSGDTQRFMEWGMSMSARMLPDNQEYQQTLQKAWTAWKECEFGPMTGSFSMGSASEGLLRYAAVVEVTPSSRVRKLMREMTATLGTIELYGIKQTMTVQPDAEEIEGRSIDLLTVEQEIDARLDPAGMQEQMHRIMFGPDGMISRIAYFSEGYAMTMGGGRPAMEEFLKSFDGVPNQDLERRRSDLIAKSNLLVLVDVSGMVVQGMKVAGSIPGVPIPVDTDQLTQLRIEPSYVGFSLAAETNAVRTKTVVPLDQLRSVSEIVGLFK